MSSALAMILIAGMLAGTYVPAKENRVAQEQRSPGNKSNTIRACLSLLQKVLE
jgi:hypothetical protein